MIYPLELPTPISTVMYCDCGRKLGCQDPGEQCTTCKWIDTEERRVEKKVRRKE